MRDLELLKTEVTLKINQYLLDINDGFTSPVVNLFTHFRWNGQEGRRRALDFLEFIESVDSREELLLHMIQCGGTHLRHSFTPLIAEELGITPKIIEERVVLIANTSHAEMAFVPYGIYEHMALSSLIKEGADLLAQALTQGEDHNANID